QHVSAERNGLRGTFRAEGLYAMPVPGPMHAIEAGAPDHRVVATRAARGVAGRPAATGDRGVPPAVRGPSRDRGDTGTSGAALWLTTLPVHWSGQSPPAACPDGGGAERDPVG